MYTTIAPDYRRIGIKMARCFSKALIYLFLYYRQTKAFVLHWDSLILGSFKKEKHRFIDIYIFDGFPIYGTKYQNDGFMSLSCCSNSYFVISIIESHLHTKPIVL